jgi:hypothetical protein
MNTGCLFNLLSGETQIDLGSSSGSSTFNSNENAAPLPVMTVFMFGAPHQSSVGKNRRDVVFAALLPAI